MIGSFRWGCRWAVGVLTAAVPLACHGTFGSPQSVVVETLFARPWCGGSAEAPSVSWIGNREAVSEAISRRHATVLPDSEKPSGDSPVAPETAVLVELGAQPSAGYAVSLGRGVAEVSGGTATVEVRVGRPAPGGVSAAVVTSPCLLLHLPKGPYTRVRVVDAKGVELGVATVGP